MNANEISKNLRPLLKAFRALKLVEENLDELAALDNVLAGMREAADHTKADIDALAKEREQAEANTAAAMSALKNKLDARRAEVDKEIALLDASVSAAEEQTKKSRDLAAEAADETAAILAELGEKEASAKKAVAAAEAALDKLKRKIAEV